MPKYRQLHIRILDSDDFNEMPDDFTRVVWLLLPCILDSEGRGKYKITWVKSKMFPARENLDLIQLQASLDWLVDRKMIITYEVEGKMYFYIPTFKDYQKGTEKEAPSLLPPPPEVTQELVKSNSGVTQELVATNSRSTSTSNTTSTSSSDSSSISSDDDDGEVFKSFNNNICMVTPIIADALKADIKEYGKDWVLEAITTGAQNNGRSLAYVERILENRKKGITPGKRGKNNIDRTSQEGIEKYGDWNKL